MLKKQQKTNSDKSSKSDSDYDGDVFLYHGHVHRNGYHRISELLENKQAKKPRVCLILITDGGDPDAAYRIARAINHHYEKVEILIPDKCKSAGTLLCIGANKLIFGDRGELGPLDVQISKPDEMFENMSGLDSVQALHFLGNQMLDVFRECLLDIRFHGRLGTRVAADIAGKLADGFMAPIMAKVDPATLGEHLRATQIGQEYGRRLDAMSKSLKPKALANLVTGFPSHTFVIDRKEAKSLFENVTAPDKITSHLYQWAREIIEKNKYPQSPVVEYVQSTQTGGNIHEAKNHQTDDRLKNHCPDSNGNSEQESKRDK